MLEEPSVLDYIKSIWKGKPLEIPKEGLQVQDYPRVDIDLAARGLEERGEAIEADRPIQAIVPGRIIPEAEKAPALALIVNYRTGAQISQSQIKPYLDYRVGSILVAPPYSSRSCKEQLLRRQFREKDDPRTCSLRIC
jgi:hypothetical protein